jgi:hypothetical protein
MVKGIASAGVVAFVVLGACAAVCQSGRESLPDAPSAVAHQAQALNAFVHENALPLSPLPLNVGAMGAPARPMRQDDLLVFDRTASRHRDPDAIFRKYLSSSSGKRQPGYQSAGGGNLVGRATHAASRTVVTRDESGKGRLNISYLLRAVTSVAKDTASTPYWRRSVGAPLNNFGSTVGSDAGMNLWREFGPGIQRLAKNHTPLFISKIEERIGRR